MDTFTDRDWRYFFYIHELLDPKYVENLITVERKREATCTKYKSEFLRRHEQMFEILINELELGLPAV